MKHQEKYAVLLLMLIGVVMISGCVGNTKNTYIDFCKVHGGSYVTGGDGIFVPFCYFITANNSTVGRCEMKHSHALKGMVSCKERANMGNREDVVSPFRVGIANTIRPRQNRNNESQSCDDVFSAQKFAPFPPQPKGSGIREAIL